MMAVVAAAVTVLISVCFYTKVMFSLVSHLSYWTVIWATQFSSYGMS